MGPEVLAQLLGGFKQPRDPNLLVGFDSSDDAAVYRVSADLCLISTLDFFPPIVDDPYQFGQIAAANAISDVYAMGGEPKLALNLLTFPQTLELEAVRLILQGGHDKAMEAGMSIAGGHSIQDTEPKYGMSVIGFVHPDHLLTNRGALPGDELVLTKPLGSGILTTAMQEGLLTDAEIDRLIGTMSALNRTAAVTAHDFKPHACTDITGFGLLGHAAEMAADGTVTFQIDHRQIPLLPRVLEFAADGLIPGGAYRNRDFLKAKVGIAAGVPLPSADVLYDPQTSGGLLFALPAEQTDSFLAQLHSRNVPAARIGQVVPYDSAAVRVI